MSELGVGSDTNWGKGAGNVRAWGWLGHDLGKRGWKCPSLGLARTKAGEMVLEMSELGVSLDKSRGNGAGNVRAWG
jgi:hypothetical protein